MLLYRVSYPGLQRPGRDVDRPPPSSAEVKERVDPYLYSPSGPSLFLLQWTLRVTVTMSRIIRRDDGNMCGTGTVTLAGETISTANETCINVSLSSTNPTWASPGGSGLDLCCEVPTDRALRQLKTDKRNWKFPLTVLMHPLCFVYGRQLSILRGLRL